MSVRFSCPRRWVLLPSVSLFPLPVLYWSGRIKILVQLVQLARLALLVQLAPLGQLVLQDQLFAIYTIV